MSESEDIWRLEYLKRQDEGVQYEFRLPVCGTWRGGIQEFCYPKECYREVKPTIPHLAERALYWTQRAAGTNEQWQYRIDARSTEWFDISVGQEPRWLKDTKYRVKPDTSPRCLAMLQARDGTLASGIGRIGESEKAFRKREEGLGWKIIGEIAIRDVEIIPWMNGYEPNT